MAFHFIAIASDFAQGKRIGWHYSSEHPIDKQIISSFIDNSFSKLNAADYGIHKLSTETLSWDSVVNKDSFFSDVRIIEEQDVFFDMLLRDKDISALDIAKFFLSITTMTNLKLQKLVCFAYYDYLSKYGKKLFQEPIVAYKYGPVVEEVYQKYKCNGKNEIYGVEPKFQLSEITLPISILKLELNDNGSQIIDSLLETVNKFIDKDAGELVEISHEKNSPWSKVYEQGCNNIITDSDIIEMMD